MSDNIYDDLRKYSYEALHLEALNAVAEDVDKREGSVVFDMTAPAAMNLAKSFDVLYQVAMQSRIQTATGPYLDLCASQNKIYRNRATRAKWRILVEPVDVELEVRGAGRKGTRFISSNGNHFEYEVIESEGEGCYVVECLVAGSLGGRDFGELEEIPITRRLKRVSFVRCLDGGREEESDSDFRLRWWSIVRSDGYGGNFYDYQRWILSEFAEQEGGYAFDGVLIFPSVGGGGEVHVVPTIRTVGGGYMPADEVAVRALNRWLDPEKFSGHGAGMAPIGHKVSVGRGTERAISVGMKIKMESGIGLDEERKGRIREALEKYFEGRRRVCVTKAEDGYRSMPYKMEAVLSAMSATLFDLDIGIASVKEIYFRGVLGAPMFEDLGVDIWSADQVELFSLGGCDIMEDSDE